MLKILSIISLTIASAPAFAHGGPDAGPAMIGHNATHKIERLVTLRQVDSHFQDRLYSVEISPLTRVKHDDPAYKAVVSQVPDATGKAQQVEMLFSDAGKALSFKAVAGPESLDAPAWPDADSLTLLENGIHYVLDNGATKTELKPYFTALTSATLSAAKDSAGKPLALVQIMAKDTKAVLEVYLKTDGSFDSSKILTPAK